MKLERTATRRPGRNLRRGPLKRAELSLRLGASPRESAMKKAKRELLEYEPARDGALGLMDEFNRQMNGLADGLAGGRSPSAGLAGVKTQLSGPGDARQQAFDRARRERGR
jgi:hypothetical protein